MFVTCREPQGVAYWGAYAASKAALEQLALIYKAEVEGITPVRVSVLDPGPVATKLRAEAFPGIDPATLPQPESVVERFVEALGDGVPRL